VVRDVDIMTLLFCGREIDEEGGSEGVGWGEEGEGEGRNL
jgi:hypothetical protein